MSLPFIKAGDRIICISPIKGSHRGSRYGKVATIERTYRRWIKDTWAPDPMSGYYEDRCHIKWEDGETDFTVWSSLTSHFVAYDDKIIESLADQQRRQAHADKYL